MINPQQSLSDNLVAHGYTHKPAKHSAMLYARDICNEQGEVVFTGNSQAAWQWLRQQCGDGVAKE